LRREEVDVIVLGDKIATLLGRYKSSCRCG